LLVLLVGCSQKANHGESGLKAAIIDQLYILEPDRTFIDQVKAHLEASGFTETMRGKGQFPNIEDVPQR